MRNNFLWSFAAMATVVSAVLVAAVLAAFGQESAYVVVRDGVTLNARSGAGTEFSIYQKLAPGTQLKRLYADDDWLFVQMADGTTFWVNNAFVDPLVLSGTGAAPVVSLHPLVQQGHTEPIADLAFSDDGRFVVTGASDDVVRLWEVASGQLIRSFRGHKADVSAVAISGDNRYIAAGGGTLGRATFVFVWDSRTGAVVHRHEGHSQVVDAVAFSPDGRLVASGGADNFIHVWEAATGKRIAELTGIGYIYDVAFSADGRLLMGVSDNKLRIWSMGSFGEAATIHSGGGLTNAAFDPSGQFVYTDAANHPDNPLRKWKVSDGSRVQDFVFAEEALSGDIAISADGGLLALYGSDGRGSSVVLFDTQTGLETGRWHTTFGHDRIDIAPSGDVLIAQDNTAEIRNAKNGTVRHRLDGNAESVAGLSVARSEAILAVANSRSGAVGNNWGAIWDLETGEQRKVFRDWNFHGVDAIAMTPDAGVLVTGAFRDLKWWLLSDPDRAPRQIETDNPVKAMAFSQDGLRHIVITHEFGQPVEASVRDIRSGKIVAQEILPENPLRPPVFSADGSHLLIRNSDPTGKEGATVLRRTTDFAEVAKIEETSDRTVAISDDGSLVAYIGPVGVPEVAAIRNGRPVKIRDFVHNGVTAMAISPDGVMLLTGAEDGGARLWSIETGAEIAVLQGHRDPILHVGFSREARLAITAGTDGSVRLWDAGSGRQRVMLSTFEDGSWIAITPEGFFNASARGAQKLGLIDGLDVLAVDQTFDALFRPDLVAEALAGDPRGKVREAASRLDLAAVLASGAPPRLAFAERGPIAASNADHAMVTAVIEDAGGGVGRIEWRVNGLVLGVDTPDAASGRNRVTRRLPLLPGENEIVVIAYNRAELIASKPAVMNVSRTRIEEARGRLFVLAVGIDDYADNVLDLNFAVADARAIAVALEKASGDLYEDVYVLEVSDSRATEDGIRRAVDELESKVRPEDTFVFFAAGHGKTENGRYFFVPHDFSVTGGDQLAAKGIGQEKFQDWFARISAFRSVLMFDTCESGTLTDGDGPEARFLQLSGAGRLSRAVGRTTLAASSGTEPALEGYQGHGVFTYTVLEAISQGDSNADELIAVDELAEYLQELVPLYSQEAFSTRQIPHILISGDSFDLIRQATAPNGDGSD